MRDFEGCWDEAKATRLLRSAGALVTGYEEASGERTPNRAAYHARLVAAHDARDMAAYQEALNGYVEAARGAYRRASRRHG